AKASRSFPVVLLSIPFRAAVVRPRPRKPGAIHFDAEYNNHWVTKTPRGIAPFVDVRVPFAGKNLGQTELVRSVVFLIRPVPRRPKHKRQRTVPPDDIEIVRGKILFSPVTGRRDDGLMFTHHLLKILDRLESDIVLRVAKIHERPGVCAMFSNHHLDRAVRIDWRNRYASTASD